MNSSDSQLVITFFDLSSAKMYRQHHSMNIGIYYFICWKFIQVFDTKSLTSSVLTYFMLCETTLVTARCLYFYIVVNT